LHSNISGDSLLQEEDKPLTSMGKRNYAGLYRSIAAKVLAPQFIVDSLISLSIVHRWKADGLERSEVLKGIRFTDSERSRAYSITAGTIAAVCGELTRHSLFECNSQAACGPHYTLIEYESASFAQVSADIDIRRLLR
jgi:hypothetical protein